ncbi:restriction endonuclease subunit S [Bacillus sp. FJAT-29814]|uniref:restriction endonuclease subunit S n=1 Tax=Bacillus sp. FJAT-29814 TaxID=1729688 RepID=UPI000829BD57|nr:restriction endonuclease subunit S [Bacillus sp. FJAT-29814]
MGEMRSLPYDIINNDEWVVASLFSKQNMESIKGTPLNEIVDFNPERLNEDQIVDNREYRYVDLSCITDEGILLSAKKMQGKELPARARLIVKQGDILISTVRPERNLVAVVTDEFEGCIVTTTFAVLRPQGILAEVLYFLLRSIPFNEQITALSTGMTVPTVKLKDLKDLEVPDNCFHDAIKREAPKHFSLWLERNNSIKTTQQVVEEVFSKNNVLIKEDLLEQSSLYIPYSYKKLKDRLDVGYYMDSTRQDWSVETKSLDDVTIEFRAGAAIPSKEYKSEGVPYVRIKDLKENIISDEELVFIDEKIKDKNDKSTMHTKELLISRVGTIGKAALVNKKYEGAVANQHLTIVKPDINQIIPEFLVYYFNTTWAEKQFVSRSGGVAQQFIKLGAIKTIKVPVPTIQLQQKIINEVNQELKLMDHTVLKKQVEEFSNLLFN